MKLLQTIFIPAVHTSLLAFSPDGSQLALVGAETVITIFDLRINKILRQWDMHSSITSLNFLEDGDLVCLTEQGDILRLVDGAWKLVKTLNDGYLIHAIFIPERQAFVAVYTDSTQLVSPHDGQSQRLSFMVPCGWYLLLLNDIRVVVDRDLSLISAYKDDKLVKQLTLDVSFDQPVSSPKGDQMATLDMDPDGAVLTLWQIPSLEQVRTFSIPEASGDVVNDVVFSPDGNRIAVLATPYTVKILSLSKDSQFEITLSDQFASIADLAISPQGKLWALNCVGTSLNIVEVPSNNIIDQWNFSGPSCGELLDGGSSLAVAEWYKNVKIYKVREANNPVPINAHCCNVFSADGSVGASSGEVASSGDPIVISIWQQSLGFPLEWRYHQEGYQAFQLAVSASGRVVAATNRFKTHLYIRGIENGVDYPALGSKISFSPDEKSLASAFQILDLNTGTTIDLEDTADLPCSPDSFSPPEFSPDGRILAMATCGRLRFWQTSDGVLLKELDDSYGSSELKFASDGTFLVGRGIGNVSVWGVSNLAP